MTSSKEVRLVSKVAVGLTYLLTLGGSATVFAGASAEASHNIELANAGNTSEQLHHDIALDEELMIGSAVVTAATLLTLPGIIDSLESSDRS